MKLMITCGEATDFNSKKEEGKLCFRQKIQLAIHLYLCELCRFFSKQNKVITRGVGKIHEHIDARLSEGQKNELIEVLENL